MKTVVRVRRLVHTRIHPCTCKARRLASTPDHWHYDKSMAPGSLPSSSPISLPTPRWKAQCPRYKPELWTQGSIHGPYTTFTPRRSKCYGMRARHRPRLPTVDPADRPRFHCCCCSCWVPDPTRPTWGLMEQPIRALASCYRHLLRRIHSGGFATKSLHRATSTRSCSSWSKCLLHCSHIAQAVLARRLTRGRCDCWFCCWCWWLM